MASGGTADGGSGAIGCPPNGGGGGGGSGSDDGAGDDGNAGNRALSNAADGTSFSESEANSMLGESGR